MSVGFGGGASETKAKVIPFSENELALQDINLDVARAQLASIFAAQDDTRGLSQAFRSVLPAFLPGFELQGQASQSALERINQIALTGRVSESQGKVLDDLERNQITAIQDSTREGLEMLRQELAPQRGLRSSDSPILDRGGQLAREGMRLEAGVRANRAAAELSLPQQEMAMLQALSNQDFTQRLALGQLSTQAGIGLANTGNAVGAAEFRPNVASESESFQFNNQIA